MLIGSGLPYQPLDRVEMVAQDMRNVGVGFAQPDDDLEQLPDGAAGAACFFRQPERAQPGLADEVDLRERKGTLAFAVAALLLAGAQEGLPAQAATAQAAAGRGARARISAVAARQAAVAAGESANSPFTGNKSERRRL